MRLDGVDALTHHMSMTTTKLSDFTLATLGTWAHGPAKLTSSYHDETTVRVDTEGQSRVMTEREWLQMYDDIRDAGYTRA